MAKRFSLGILVFALLYTIASAADIVYSEKTFQAGPGSVIVFHSLEQKPIHIGDGGGKIDDIPQEFRSQNPPTGYGWKFNLVKEPASAELYITMYSLMRGFGCTTLVKVNGKILKDLAELPDADSGQTSSATILIKGQLRVGINEIVISEEQCVKIRTPAYSRALNDSLIKEVKLRLD